MTFVLSPVAKQAFLDNNGDPLVGGKLFVYQAGTTTKTNSYSNSAGALNTNPIILDYRGECNLWVDANIRYKYVLARSTDTDPPTNPIWTVDQLVNSQLVTLYGGVDSGVVNAYVLNFTANFTAYTDGTVIYWVPSNTNTASSTLNVNGLGNVLILNQNGGSLSPGQIFANQIVTVMYRAGFFYLVSSGQTSNVSGSATLSATGFTTVPTPAIKYDINGHTACVTFFAFSATSNSISFTLTGLPSALVPVQSQQISIGGSLLNSGSVLVSSEVSLTGGSSTVVFTVLANGTAFTAAGTKGINKNFAVSWVLN